MNTKSCINTNVLYNICNINGYYPTKIETSKLKYKQLNKFYNF